MNENTIQDAESYSEHPQSFEPQGCPDCGYQTVVSNEDGQYCEECGWNTIV